MNIGMACFPTYGGSGVVATELGIALAGKGHKVHFMSYSQPFRLNLFNENLFYHEFNVNDYPLFEYQPYESVLASKIVDVAIYEQLDVLHVHYAVPHATAAVLGQARALAIARGGAVVVVDGAAGTIALEAPVGRAVVRAA